MESNLLCPVDGVQINETKVRLTAGFILLITLVYLLTGWVLLPVLLLADFGLRSFHVGEYSPLGNGASWIVKVLRLPYKATDQAPKRFAARIGFGFSLLILSLDLAHRSTLLPASILAVFAALESVFGFCAGCYVYTFYVRLFSRAA
ncbi:DUF4395 domain-containing protein [Spirosoma sp. RP8]|uniref:DUF4395 domain-containing protein n=1 Tax=Spirosoma liriopis TaxID=2937440 RepID=A0ABT0HR36_9BACT|nr:DUF4395 domain-containing protein [Spirosoma liriopis]MCK8494644.1 DUF4395 domain-containing protein [Spirosoma liriopis]